MDIFKKSFLELVGVIALVLVVSLVLYYFAKDDVGVRVVKASLAGEDIVLEVADNTYLKNLGLSGRKEMSMDYGMIFVYETELEGLTFWMKNTLIPLDMIFFNEDFEVVHIIENVPVCEEEPCEKYTFDGNAQYVVELNSGWVEEHGVTKGDELEFKALDLSGS